MNPKKSRILTGLSGLSLIGVTYVLYQLKKTITLVDILDEVLADHIVDSIFKDIVEKYDR